MPVSNTPVTRTCLKCGYVVTHINAGKLFSTHLRQSHGLSTEQYVVECYYGGVRHMCREPGCEQITRFTRDLENPEKSIKEYCKAHALNAMSSGGKIGGKKTGGQFKGQTKHTNPSIMKQSITVTGLGNHFYGKTHKSETIEIIRKNKTLKPDVVEDRVIANGNFELLTLADEYYSRQGQYLAVKCLTCSEVQQKTLQSLERETLCIKCHKQMKSIGELEVYDFVKKHCADAISGDYTVLGGHKQLDVFVPSKKFAIEYNGLYFHSEKQGQRQFAKSRHLVKTEQAAIQDIQLMHIFSDEWKNKAAICKSMILHRLGLQQNKIYARKCELVQLTKTEQYEFFTANHISGAVSCRIAFGLKFDGDIVAAISLRIPMQANRKKDNIYKNCLEIGRFCTKTFHSVSGALSRLLKHAEAHVKAAGYQSVMTYADRRFGTGKGYLRTGFELKGATAPNFWYADSVTRYDRLKFKADKKNHKTEAQVAQEAGVARIYGCGSFIYIKEL